ncbi:hypothetical protein CVT25_012714 [Psilocybe cyanescens]|uniref:Xylanolytic transcriptional activator regulatory domain-containing protein n=1 Tax=Psilocybe cyanescens TaxID=93625 RepID=A0A409XS73_PSICY|nr:hypothetical protein CVT25_012714 [Psilocybe cyanescens]
MDSLSSDSAGGNIGKEKKTRRRLRLSCVECTKRRQATHLCRWESVPVARPAPARPPISALREASLATNHDQEELIADLKHRIAALEHELSKAREQPSSPFHTLSSGSCTQSTSPSSNATDVSTNSGLSPGHDHLSELSHRHPSVEILPEQSFRSTRGSPDLLPIAYPLDDATYESISYLAHLSLAHHGEFIGRGSLICALHSMTTRKVPRFLYTKSTDPMSEYREPVQRFSDISFAGSVEELVSLLPSMMVVETLTSAFFAEVNWRYTIPEEWFREARSQMWSSLQHRRSQINTNWLVLLFAVLASAPQSAYDEVKPYSATRSNDDYFMCAMLARRLVEDEFLNVPNKSIMVSAADGTVLGCLAIPMLCNYLAERGRISEAWKLAGQGIRNAEAVGMHRDPEWRLWQMMSKDEKLLRRRAWWGLFISDKTYSYILGRPQILRPETFEVDSSPSPNPDGTRNLTNIGLNIIVSLMDLLSNAIEKMDRSFEEWEERLPTEYQLGSDSRLLQGYSPSELKLLAHQRYFIHTWHMIGRLKFHLALTTGLGTAAHSPTDIRRSMETCVTITLQIIRFQSATYKASLRPNDENFAYVYPVNCWLFEGCFSLFEATVALITTMARLRWHEMEAETNSAIDLAMFVFDKVARREKGKTRESATRAIEVLTTIRDQDWSGKGDTLRLPRIKVDPESMDMEMDKGAEHTFSMTGTFAPSPQFSLGPMQPNNIHLPKFSQLDDFVGYDRGAVGAHDHMDVSHVGNERSTIQHL